MSFRTQAPPAAMAVKPRTQNEALVRWASKECYRLGEVRVTATDACEWTADESVPVGEANMHLMAGVVFPLGAADLTLTISGTRGGSDLISESVTLSANSTYDVAGLVPGGEGWTSISSVTCTGGTANDVVYIYAVPDPDQFTRLAYIRNWDLDPGPFSRPIPDLFDPARVQIRTRREPTLTISKDYVDLDGFDSVRGKTFTLMLEVHPGGGPNVVEYIYFPRCYLSPDQSAPDNEILVSSAAGGSRTLLCYKPSG